jgi:cytochrome c5
MSDPPSTAVVPRIFPTYLLGFVAAAVVIGIGGTYALPPLQAKSPAEMTPAAIAARLAPVSHLEIAGSKPERTLRSGDTVYAGVCVACHGTGVAGAPKVGDKAQWAHRIAKGFDTLVDHATDGFKGMPPKGGDTSLDPQEVARAVAWMADQAGASFKAP